MAKGNSAGSVSVDLTLNNKNYDNQVKSSIKGTENAFSGTMKKIGALVAGAFATKQVIGFAKTCIDSASKMQSAFTGLNSIVQGTGNSFSQAEKFVKEYTKDGLVSIEETATAYKNLLARGYDTSQIEDVMTRLKDSASFGRQASYDLGEAVVSATEGLKNENSILVDNAGVTKNVAKMWEEWAKAHNTTTSAMTQAQKVEAEYNGIMQETKFQVGDASAYTKTFGGRVQQLKFNISQMTVAIGKVIAPLAQLFIPVINSAINAVTNFFNSIQKLLKTFGLEMPDVISKGSSSLSGLGTNAVDTASDIASTGDVAKKTAKDINKAFSNVDEINVLSNSNQSSTGSDSGGGIETTTVTPDLSDINNVTEQTTNSFSLLKDKFLELKNLFKTGFDLTFDFDLKSIKKSIKNITKQLQSIFTDKKLMKSVDNFVNSFSFNLGKIVGSTLTIGSNIAEGIVKSIESYLSNNGQRVSGFLSKMFDINTDKFNIAGDLMQSLSSISEVLKSSVAVEISNDIMSIFVNPFMSLTAVFTQFGLDMFSFLVTPITSNNDLIKTGLENTLKAIQPLSDTLSNIFTTFGDIVTNVYDNHLKPFFDSVTSGVSDTFGKFLNVYNEFIAPFFEHLTENVKDVWDNHLKKLWTNIGDFIGSIIDFIKVLWENWIKPLVDWIVENIVPKIIPVLQTIYDNFSKVFSVITDVINGVITSLKGVMEFITGVFSGNWEKAWTGIKDVFKGIVDSFVSIFKVPINAIIKGINKFIDGVNKIHLPDWDILGSYAGKGFNIKKIPELAQGGWVAPNSPQLAIVGDNTREGEIVTPESKMYEQCVKAINDSKVNSDQSTEMHIYVHYEDGRTIINRINKTQREEGRILLEV